MRGARSGTVEKPAKSWLRSWRPTAAWTTCWCSVWPAAACRSGGRSRRALRAPLDVFLVRKLGVPQWQELAMGAIAIGGGVVVNDSLVRNLGISDEQLAGRDRPRNRRTTSPRAGLPRRAAARRHRGQDRDPGRRRHRHRRQHARRGARGEGGRAGPGSSRGAGGTAVGVPSSSPRRPTTWSARPCRPVSKRSVRCSRTSTRSPTTKCANYSPHQRFSGGHSLATRSIGCCGLA